MNTPASVPSPPPVPLVLRLVRSLALLGLTLAGTLILGVLVLSQPSMRAAMETLCTSSYIGYISYRGHQDLSFASGLILVLIGLTPVALLVAAWRLRLRSWWWIGGGYLAVAPLLAYLACDDPVILRPLTVEEIAPAFPGADTSFAVLMRYGRQHPLGRDFQAPAPLDHFPDFTKPAAARPLLTANRAKIAADWAGLAPVRAWWTELNAFDRIGDLTPARADAEVIAFAVVRAYCQRAEFVAGLQAIDGQGDAALATLLPVIEVTRKLEPSARTLVRSMIAQVMQRTALEAAGFVLDTAPVSPAVRARFATALTGGTGGEAGARRMIALDEAMTFEAYLNQPLGDIVNLDGDHRWLVRPLNLVSPFLYHPRATCNLFGDLTAGLQALAAHREIGRMDRLQEEFFEREGRLHFQNFVGALICSTMRPSYTKVTQSYWRTEDARIALRARLTSAAPPVVAAPVAGEIGVLFQTN